MTVGIAVADAELAGRLTEAVGAHSELAPATGPGAADIVIVAAERLAEIDAAEAALVVLGNAAADGLPLSPRAILPADADAALVTGAVRLVARGLLVLPDAALEPAAAGRDEEDIRPAEQQVQLTPREREVLELLAAGASNKLIARRMEVSVHTAKFHVASLFRKLGASGRLDAVGIGLRTGLLMV